MAGNNLLNILEHNDLSFIEKRTLFMGIVANAIFSRTNFKKNKELHSYVNIFEEEFQVINRRTKEAGFAKYVYASRTLLFSRISKLLYEVDTPSVLNRLIDRHREFFELKSKRLYSKKTNHKKETSILADMELNNEWV